MTTPMKTEMHPHYAETGSIERKRSRTDWAGVGFGDAFRFANDYRVRLLALSMLTRAIKEAQRLVATHAGIGPQSSGMPKVQAQLSPCYTAYPARMAASAAIGLTAFLEYRELSSSRLLERFIELDSPEAGSDAGLAFDQALYEELTHRLTRCVQTRLLLEDLSRAKGLDTVEAYRLFVAAHCNRTSLRTVVDIVQAAVLYGDMLPADLTSGGHPLAVHIAIAAASVCQRFIPRLRTTRSDRLIALGCDWVKALRAVVFKSISDYRTTAHSSEALGHEQVRLCDGESMPDALHSAANDEPMDLDIPPDGAPEEPALFESARIGDLLGEEPDEALSEFEQDLIALREQLGEKSDEELRARTLAEFQEAAREASGKQSKWEDMRSDLLEFILASGAFENGPIEGNPTDGHLVAVHFDTHEMLTGEQFDCTVALSDDIAACAELLDASQPTITAIRRILYPSIERVPSLQRVCTSGVLDPARLALGNISSAVFRRSHMVSLPDRRGRALLVVACDGSGSLSSSQMRVLKILTCSWLMATARTDVQVLAGLYHSGTVRAGFTGPLVQWIAHPKQSTARSNQDAVRALVTLPDTGTGIQHDALSLAYIMDEARSLTRGTIYLIHLTDCKWNESFNTGIGGEEEVHSLLRSWRNDIPNLHITTVGLGVGKKTGIESLVDRTIILSDEDLEDEAAVADSIGRYVASCIAERRNQLIV